MNSRKLLFLSFILLLISCKNQNPTEGNPSPPEKESNQPISFKTEKQNWSEGDCDGNDRSCLEISLSYPIAINGKTDVAENINEHIQDYLITSLYMEEPEDEITTLKQAAQRFIGSFKEESDPDMAAHWAVEIDGKHAIYKNTLVIRLLSYTNTGGAHPNVYQSFTNFDLTTGEEIYYEDFVTDTTALQQLAEARFYATRKKMDGEIDKDDAFWGKPFYLPENFAITKNGLKLFYNNYEALAYVYGPTEYVLTYEELEGVIEMP